MRGASALQTVLEGQPRPLAVFVVWEPVIASDVAPPSNRTLARVADTRAAQYWDEDRVLSQDLVADALADPSLLPPDESGSLPVVDETTIFWDVVALFPAGARWEESIPKPIFVGYPVVDVVDGLRRELEGLAPQ